MEAACHALVPAHADVTVMSDVLSICQDFDKFMCIPAGQWVFDKTLPLTELHGKCKMPQKSILFAEEDKTCEVLHVFPSRSPFCGFSDLPTPQ